MSPRGTRDARPPVTRNRRIEAAPGRRALLGFAVKVLGPDGTGMPTHDTRRVRSGPSLARSLELAGEVVGWLRATGIRYWRLPSQLAPYASHPDHPELRDAPARNAEGLAALGRALDEAGVRVTMHPGQYTVLGTPDPDVLARSVEDLAVQAEILDLMGRPAPEACVLIHLGGRYGDPDAAVERLCRAVDALPDPVRRRLAFENDDRLWDAAEVLAVCRRLGVPMVFDIHHHRVLDRAGIPALEALEAALATWPAGAVPEVHLSTGRSGPGDRLHADGISPADWERTAGLIDAAPRAFDVMVEARHKDHAVIRVAEGIAAGRLRASARDRFTDQPREE